MQEPIHELFNAWGKRDIDAYQLQMKAAKAQRDARRKAGNLSEEEKAEMVRESQFMKAQLRRLKKERDRKTDIEEEYDRNQKDIRYLKQLRKELSDSLQRWLFGKFTNHYLFFALCISPFSMYCFSPTPLFPIVIAFINNYSPTIRTTLFYRHFKSFP